MRSDRKQCRLPRARGMTLIEILVVLVLIGVVMGIVGGNFIGQGENAKRKAAKIEIEQIGQTLDLFKLEIGRYPTSQEGLQALITAPAGINNWNGPYWKKGTVPKDPWGNEYSSRRRDNTARTTSSRSGPTARKAATAPTRTSRVGNDAA